MSSSVLRATLAVCRSLFWSLRPVTWLSRAIIVVQSLLAVSASALAVRAYCPAHGFIFLAWAFMGHYFPAGRERGLWEAWWVVVLLFLPSFDVLLPEGGHGHLVGLPMVLVFFTAGCLVGRLFR